MITALVSVVALAALFAVFGLLKQRVGCSGDCDHCTHGCDINKGDSHV